MGFRVASSKETEEQDQMDQRAELAAQNKGRRHEK